MSNLQELVDEALKGRELGKCVNCLTQLTPNNVAYWIGDDICRSCVKDPLTGNYQPSVDFVLEHGYLYLFPLSGNWSMRVECKTKDRNILLRLHQDLGGKLTPNEKGVSTWRWHAGSRNDLHTVGRAIFNVNNRLGRLLIEYTEKSMDERTLFVKGLVVIFGKRYIPLSEIK